MNLEQRELIKSALDRAAAEDPDAQAYIRYWEEERSGLQPLFVKNLELVQGDERDVILIRRSMALVSRMAQLSSSLDE